MRKIACHMGLRRPIQLNDLSDHFCSLSNCYFFEMIAVFFSMSSVLYTTEHSIFVCFLFFLLWMWIYSREKIFYIKWTCVSACVNHSNIRAKTLIFFFNQPRLAALTTSVTSGRPNKFCQADFKKLISPFRMSMVSSLSLAM